jgi:hypothetical protein
MLELIELSKARQSVKKRREKITEAGWFGEIGNGPLLSCP